MTVTVHSTDQIVDAQGGVKCRVWEGETESGIKVTMLVPRIAAHKDQDLSQFERELVEHKPPTLTNVFPLRMIL